MRAIFILFIFIITSCAPIEVAKEITKASKSLETSIKKISKRKEKEKKDQILSVEEENNEQILLVEEENNEQILFIEKEEIAQQKLSESKVISKQKKFTTPKLSGKTLNELNRIFGEPMLIREEGKTTIARYDSESCRIFVFMNATMKKLKVEYYELRNDIGKLIEQEKDIEKCFIEIKLT